MDDAQAQNVAVDNEVNRLRRERLQREQREAEAQPRYAMVYRCPGDGMDDLLGGCGFATQSYAAVDEHENNYLGHLMTGQMEKVNSDV